MGYRSAIRTFLKFLTYHILHLFEIFDPKKAENHLRLSAFFCHGLPANYTHLRFNMTLYYLNRFTVYFSMILEKYLELSEILPIFANDIVHLLEIKTNLRMVA